MALSKPLFSKTLLYFVVTSLIAASKIEDHQNEFESLPFCNEHFEQDKKLVLVSTLDGKFSALNAENGGVESWSLPTGPGPMLSSSIHRMELTNKGHWVRMIPSLSGHIYKFDGESLEAVPVNADQLLKNSFRYSDDLVISGGRETRTYGVEAETGRVLYECTMRGCDNLTSEGITDGHILVLKRESQTIRAIEPRTGAERWNYSVAQHELKLAADPRAECHHSNVPSDLQIKIIVPEGLVCALSKKDPHKILWKHKFDSPVVHAWQYGKGQLEILDLFSGSLVPPWSSNPSSPSLYIGMHHKQLYIQESVRVQPGVTESSLELEQQKPLRIPWKPYAAASQAVGWPDASNTPQIASGGEDSSTTALSVLYASEYVNGNGFYLFDPRDKVANAETYCDNETVSTDLPPLPEEEEGETPVQIIIVSLWYWWREVLIISITTAILFNLFFTQRFLYLIQSQYVREPVLIVQKKNSDSGLDRTPGYKSIEAAGCTESFSSRYLDDFEQVRCLGRGGFGVVFEARKKIDDCSYAVKRIQLPYRKESRDRVMREVKALAKLEHHHIVRYYHSWLECPPSGWQEQQDRGWLKDYEAQCSRDSVLSNEGTYEESSDTPNNNQLLLPLFKRSTDVAVNMPDDCLRAAKQDFSDSLIQFRDPSNGTHKPTPRNSLSLQDFSDSVQFREPSHQTTSQSGPLVQQQPCRALGTYVPLPSTDSSASSEEESLSIPSSSGSSPAKLKPRPMFLYIQMQLCRPESLKDWLQLRNSSSGVQTVEALHLFQQITHAVEYVHMQGLIHRDLKPSNIFFSLDGYIKVGDFGLVTDALGRTDDPEGGQRTPCEEKSVSWTNNEEEKKHTANVGTRLYMSPEQLHGLPYDHKVDIFSLGIILFELLWPFSTQMERADTLQAVREHSLPPSFETSFGLESSLLLLMLSHAPEERPSAQEIRQRLITP